MNLAIVAVIGVIISAAGIVTTRGAKDPLTANLGMLTVGVGVLVLTGAGIAVLL